MRHMTCDMWPVTCDKWHVIHDMWHVTCDMRSIVIIIFLNTQWKIYWKMCFQSPCIRSFQFSNDSDVFICIFRHQFLLAQNLKKKYLFFKGEKKVYWQKNEITIQIRGTIQFLVMRQLLNTTKFNNYISIIFLFSLFFFFSFCVIARYRLSRGKVDKECMKSN